MDPAISDALPVMSDALPVAAIIIVFVVTFLLLLLPQIFYLLTLQKCLNKVEEKNRGMSPNLVWLNLIPFFSLGWNFYLIAKIKESLINEYNSRGLQGDNNFSYKLGLAMAILACCGIIPMIGLFTGLAAFITWIIYWIKIAGYSKELDGQTPITQATAI